MTRKENYKLLYTGIFFLISFAIIGFIIYTKPQNQKVEMPSKKPIQTINPATGQKLHSYTPMGSNEVHERIQRMSLVQKKWANQPFSKRAKCIRQVAKLLRRRKDHYATLITKSMGKPITEAQAEIEKCAKLCDYYAVHAEEFLAPRQLKNPKRTSYQYYQPMGIIFAIMPWNFPFWQVFRFAIPNLMGGNGALLKHASNVMNIALEIEALFQEAGCPAGLFQSLIIGSDQVADVIAHPLVSGVTLTGSERAGARVAEQAGKLIKPVVLELGGNDAYIILEDAELDLAVKACATSRLTNAGQVCIAAKRIIVHFSIKEKFIQKLKAYVQAYYVCGDPMQPHTQLGPMVRQQDRDNVHSQVERTLQAGAKCILGGAPLDGKGFYYPATILTDIPQGAPPYTEELFGPILCVFTAESQEAAIILANESAYGLGGAVFTQDLERGKAVARKIEAGSCYINDFVISNLHLPFGGWKKSGFGTELGAEGIRSFMHIKVIVLPEEASK